ncbi:MAG: lysophospholipid acyltransferase family protein [Myxococcota bacterium]
MTVPASVHTPPEKRTLGYWWRHFWWNFLGCWPLVFLPLAGVLGSFFPVIFSPDNMGKRVATFWLRRWAKGLLKGFGIRVYRRGVENIDPATPYIVCANHRSHLDVPVLAHSLPLTPVAVHKKSLEYVPLIGQALILGRSVGIDRSDRADARRRMATVAHRMATGRSVVIFPEGTRSRGPTLDPFKKGAVMVAIEQQCKILPVTLVGTDVLYPPGNLMIHRGDALVIIHPPIDTRGYTPGQRDEVLAKVRAVIEGSFYPGALHMKDVEGAERVL